MRLVLRRLVGDIRFWIIILFLIRLIGITNPPLEGGHNWRQALTNMIARNFVEEEANIFHPRVDIAGDKSGVIGSEFPFFNYLIHLVSLLFGFEHWYGRLINLVVSSLGLYYFYRLVRNIMNERVAFHATIILGVSLWFSFSRKIMPDTFSVSMVIIGLYYAWQYLKSGSSVRLFLFFIFCTVGVLCKIPALSLVSVLALIPFSKTVTMRRKAILLSVAAMGFMIVIAWYFYWVPYLLETYGFQLYFPKGLKEGLNEILPLIPAVLEKFYFNSLMSFVAFACFLAGLVTLFKNEKTMVKLGFVIISFSFLIFIIKTGAVFPNHNYYVLPYTPVMAFIAGYFLSCIPRNLQYVLLAVIGIEAIANQQHDLFVDESERYKPGLEQVMQEHTTPGDLIIINGGPSPQLMYYANRQGWTLTNRELTAPGVIDSLHQRGAEYLVIDKTRPGGYSGAYPLIHQGEDFDVYDLE